MKIRKKQLRKAFARWEEDFRNGKTLTREEMNTVPVPQAAKMAAKALRGYIKE